MVVGLFFGGCQDRAKDDLNLSFAINAPIKTSSDSVEIEIVGTSGSDVYVNKQKIGVMPKSGKLNITLSVGADVGVKEFEIALRNDNGEEKFLYLQISKENDQPIIATVLTKGEVSSMAISDEGTLFIAQKDNGIEIISIGFDDSISPVMRASIDVYAQSVTLSDDGMQLYVKDENGRYHVVDISDIDNPAVIGSVDEINSTNEVISLDGTKTYIAVGEKGLKITEIIDMSHPLKPYMEVFVKSVTPYGIVLSDNDTRAIIAGGENGVQVLDVSDTKNITLLGSYKMEGNVTNIAFIEHQGIIFVANGEYGIQVLSKDLLFSKIAK